MTIAIEETGGDTSATQKTSALPLKKFVKVSGMAASDCEIVLVRGVDDADGYSCGRASISECADCGSNICDVHTEECDLCGEIFCASCYYSHMKEPHAKPVVPQRVQPKREHSA